METDDGEAALELGSPELDRDDDTSSMIGLEDNDVDSEDDDDLSP